MGDTKYVQEDGRWFPITLAHGYRTQCCGCGLVHDHHVRNRKKGRGLEVRILLNSKGTAAARRTRKKSVVIVED